VGFHQSDGGHGLTWHEKTLGQLFCDQKSGAIIQMLLDELAKGQGDLRLGTQITAVTHADGVFRVETPDGAFRRAETGRGHGRPLHSENGGERPRL
jgi:predicted flavoprotein YhiN